MDWKTFDEILSRAGKHSVYESSRDTAGDVYAAMVRLNGEKKLAVAGGADAFEGEDLGGVKLCALTVANSKAIMELFPYTKPVSHQGHKFTLGLGDRLGLAAPGQLRALEGKDVFPILAQQSIRELTLTNRTFPDVIAAAAFGVFQDGYKGGYGADGDHLKTREEIKYALESGCTMITLDCSAHIKDEAANLAGGELKAAYEALPAELRAHYESLYLGKELPLVGKLGEEEFERLVLVFSGAVTHAVDCYEYMGSIATAAFDFELSIDEARAVTSPAEHLIIAMELQAAKVKLSSVAPHFYGEFEKGIEYQGKLSDFARDLEIHQKIADMYGYKLSLHSGSDKFSVFPAFSRITGGHMHVKTAGTNWLEAVRVMSEKAPDLYRKAQKHALEMYPESSKYYHVSTDPGSIQDIDLLSDAYLPELVDLPASRQLMHISYGVLLAEPWFKDAFYAMMDANEEAYYEGLKHHIGRHLRYLL